MIKKVGIVLLAFGSLGVVIFACQKDRPIKNPYGWGYCPEGIPYYITGFEAKVHGAEYQNGVLLDDTLREEVKFDIIASNLIVAKASSNQPTSWFNSAFATSCNSHYAVVQVHDKKTEVFFDKPILFGGDTIPAFTNCTSYEHGLVDVFANNLDARWPGYVTFYSSPEDEFAYNFPPDWYTVYFKFVLEDSTVFRDDVTVYIDPQW